MIDLIDLILKIVFCHLVGDYVLQSDFIAKTKGNNWYHLFVHSMLYIIPFYLLFGMDWRLVVLLTSHIIIDAAKARYNKISYFFDQFCHYIIILSLYLI